MHRNSLSLSPSYVFCVSKAIIFVGNGHCFHYFQAKCLVEGFFIRREFEGRNFSNSLSPLERFRIDH
jgi:hypothetical protein